LWLDDKPLKYAYPRLFELSFNKNCSVSEAFNLGLENFTFRITLYGESLALWNSCKERCEETCLNDQVKWLLTGSGKFIVHSLYRKLVGDNMNFPYKFVWKINVPAKINKFGWLVSRRSILTRDNLLRRGWKGDGCCAFCGKNESIDHLFFECSMAKLIWALFRCSFALHSTPTSLSDCFGPWLGSFSKIDRNLVMVGVFAMLWSIWKVINDLI